MITAKVKKQGIAIHEECSLIYLFHCLQNCQHSCLNFMLEDRSNALVLEWWFYSLSRVFVRDDNKL